MTECPVCSKPVDPIRSRFAAVRDGKVVAFCSAECRDSAASGPVKKPEPEAKPKAKTPPAGTPTIAKSKTPPAGTPIVDPKKTPAGGTPKTPASGTPKSVVSVDSGPVIEIVHEPASGVVTSAKDERITQPTGKFAKEEVLEVKETVKKRADGSKGSGGADAASTAGEIADRRPRRPSGKHLTNERSDSTEAKAGFSWIDDEPADMPNARPGTVTESERRARPWLVVLLIMVVLGSGAFAVWYFILNKQKDATDGNQVTGQVGTKPAAADAELAMPPPTVDATAEAPSTEELVSQAQQLLRKYITDGPTRVRRLAAGALGRTGDPAAVAALQEAVKEERVPAATLRLAYELARAGDKGGRDALVAGLASADRSDKLDAATRLAHLGDERAKPLLESLLTIDQHKLRAAEELSRLKDPAAEKLLDQVRNNPKSTDDEKATATIALFRGGHADLAPDVRKLLDDKSWKAFAAFALAEAKDDAAKPVLEDQIMHTVGVRVRSAYALRKLGDKPSDAVLAPLVSMMQSEKDQEQIVAAEAILILAGEPQWAEYQ